MKQTLITLDNLIELASPSEPEISPDGNWVVYTQYQPDWKENAFVGQLFLVENRANSVPKQMTFSKQGSTNPCWSADGQSLFFLSHRDEDEGAQIYRLAVFGGEAERFTTLKTSIQKIKPAPDGKSIAFWAVPPETWQEKERKERYGDYVEDNVDYKRSQLWLLTVEDKKVRQLTVDDAFHVRDCRWHPDSKYIAITAMPSPDMGILLETRIYLLDVDSLALRPLCPLRTNSPCWSPDGEAIVYQRGVYEEAKGAFYKNSHLEVISLADGRVRRVEVDFDEEMTPVTWSEDGIYFWAFQRTTIHLFRVTIGGGELVQISPDDLEGAAAFDYSFDEGHSHVAMALADRDTFWEIATIDLSNGRWRRLTSYNKATEAWALPKHELYRWQSHDGTEIEGVLTRPLDFDPDKKYPLLVVIHGGPAAVSLRTRCGRYEQFFYPIYQWVSQGAIVLQPNYRGSAGYGEAFRSLNVRDMGTGDYADVISGVDALIAAGWVDVARVGAMGWSQGGYISAFITCYSDRFKAVSVGAGISNWTTYYVNTDIHPFTRIYLKSTPWDDPEIYAKTSPMTYIKSAQTPTLIQHGEKDARVPLPNAFELHQGLLDHGVESKLIIYPGMGHGPSKPKQVRHIVNDNYRWFNRHIFGIEEEVVEKVALYVVVPPADEVKKSLVADVFHFARRDKALCRVLGADGRLSETASTEWGELSVEQAEAMIKEITQQLIDNQINKVVVFSDKVTEQPTILIALGCIQIAAGGIGNIIVEHRQEAVGV